MARSELLTSPPQSGLVASAPEARSVTLTVADMHCGGCMSKIERALGAGNGVIAVRANLSTRRVHVVYDEQRTDPVRLIDVLAKTGFTAAELAVQPATTGDAGGELLKRIGVAGFAAANIMLLSVSVWAGLASDMGPGLQAAFHWISALIALPTVAYAGQPFYRSAAKALAARRLNMDVPISVAITLATLMSLYQTMRGSSAVYFDAAVTLLFFLLIGRFLDTRVRQHAEGAAQNLLALKSTRARVVLEDGTVEERTSNALKPGMRVLVAAGERFPADGTIRSGRTIIDESLITGETTPREVGQGEKVHAGTVNLGQPLEIDVSAVEEDTLLAAIARLMTAAEQGRGRYVRLADRAARYYSPAVHILGLATFLGWLVAGQHWEDGLTAAIAVLIITCPCALALAVPVVQVAAAHRLFRQGILVKAPDALERLAEIDTVVFDKTGTLTHGRPQPLGLEAVDPIVLRRAAAMAAASRHPFAVALFKAASARLGPIEVATGVEEIAGSGLRRNSADGEERLGSARFVNAPSTAEGTTLWYSAPGVAPIGFRMHDTLRGDAADIVGSLQAAGFEVELLSGDSRSAVAEAAKAAGIDTWHALQRPDQKIARLDALKQAGHKVLMVGDGLNDAPAIAAGHASLSPATAADISQTAADAIFQGEALRPVIELLGVARMQRRMALQNFGIALAYNAVSVPLAMAGYVTPLIAAIAMSTSSIAVTVNALRLGKLRCPAKAARP